VASQLSRPPSGRNAGLRRVLSLLRAEYFAELEGVPTWKNSTVFLDFGPTRQTRTLSPERATPLYWHHFTSHATQPTEALLHRPMIIPATPAASQQAVSDGKRTHPTSCATCISLEPFAPTSGADKLFLTTRCSNGMHLGSQAQNKMWRKGLSGPGT
jgi:hypothetical protein